MGNSHQQTPQVIENHLNVVKFKISTIFILG